MNKCFFNVLLVFYKGRGSIRQVFVTKKFCMKIWGYGSGQRPRKSRNHNRIILFRKQFRVLLYFSYLCVEVSPKPETSYVWSTLQTESNVQISCFYLFYSRRYMNSKFRFLDCLTHSEMIRILRHIS